MNLSLMEISKVAKIKKVESGKLLQYTLANKGDKGSISIVTDELKFADGITTLHITDVVVQDEGAEKRYKRSVKGWGQILKGLKELVEHS